MSSASTKKGLCRRFKAWEALDYSRQRYGLKNGDYDRQRHQLQLMKAIAKEATGKGMITNPPKLNSVIAAAGTALTAGTRGASIGDLLAGPWRHRQRRARHFAHQRGERSPVHRLIEFHTGI